MTMTQFTEQQLREEVEEFTDTLRNDTDFGDLRRALTTKGIDVSTVLLAAFFEDEEDSEFGAVVTRDGTAYEFVRSSKPKAKGFKSWAVVSSDRVNRYRALQAAIDLARHGGR